MLTSLFALLEQALGDLVLLRASTNSSNLSTSVDFRRVHPPHVDLDAALNLVQARQPSVSA